MVKKELMNVKIKWAKKRPAKVVAKGPEVSEIKWLDTGQVQAIPNDQLDFLNDSKESRKREK
jgi:hypothetical protein